MHIGTFVGQVDVVQALSSRLQNSRLVTVHGLGGIGKSRVAAKALQAQNAPLGMWKKIHLAALTSLLDVARAVVGALSLDAGSLTRKHPDEGAEKLDIEDVEDAEYLLSLVDTYVLEHQGTQLWFENFEFASAFAAQTLGRWLLLDPQLRVLVTSTKRLHLREEFVFEVEPLALGSDGEALQLLHQRGEEAGRTPFAASTNVHRVALVAKLDGFPLAIEMAVEQLRILSPEQLLTRLDDPNFSLKSLHQDLHPRHRSFFSAFDAAFLSLDAEEQNAFLLGALFPGPFRLESLQALLAPGLDAFSLVTRWNDASLLRILATESDERFSIFPSLKTYASHRRAETASQNEASATGDPAILEFIQTYAHDENLRILAEEPNLRFAFQQSLRLRGMPSGISTEGVRIARRLLDLYSICGPATRAKEILTEVLRFDVWSCDDDDMAAFWVDHARHSLIFGPEFFGVQRTDGEAKASAERAVERAVELHSAPDQWIALASLHALYARKQGHELDAIERYERALALAEKQKDALSTAEIGAELAAFQFENGHVAAALKGFETALNLLSSISSSSSNSSSSSGSQAIKGKVLTNYALVAQATGDFSLAQKAQQEALDIHREVQNRRFEGITLGDLAGTALVDHRPLAALHFFDQSQLCLQDAEDVPHQELLQSAGDLARARAGLPARAAVKGFSKRALVDVEHAPFVFASQIYQALSSFVRGARNLEAVEVLLPEMQRTLAQSEKHALTSRSDEVRLALQVAQELVAVAQTTVSTREALFIRRNGPVFQRGAAAEVDLSGRALLGRLLLALVDAHLVDRVGISKPAWLQAGWPDEKMSEEAAKNRLFVSVSKLRKLGLGDFIVFEHEHYRLADSLSLWLHED